MHYNTAPAELDHHNELPLEQQFAQFVEDNKQSPEQDVTRRWLYDTDSSLMVYVRKSERPIGPPIPGFAALIDGRVEHHAADVTCLEIANLEYRDRIDAVSVEDFKEFLSKIYPLCPWNVICLDHIGAPDITEWCIRHGWQAEKKTKIVRAILPDNPNVI